MAIKQERKKDIKKGEKEEEEEEEEWQNNIVVRTIIEVLGAPKEHVQNTIKLIVDTAEKDSELKVLKKEFFEAKPQESLFSTFAELEIKFKKISKLIGFCLDFMPSSVDILEPESIDFNSKDLTNDINDLLAKIHKMDMILKNLTAENKLLEKNAMLLLRNNVMINLKGGALNPEDLSKKVGVPYEQLKQFLDMWIEDGKIKFENDEYSLAK